METFKHRIQYGRQKVMRLLRAFKVCLQLHGRRCASLLLVLDILLVLLLMVPSFRDILLIRILPLPMRGVPTWDLVRTYLCSSAIVPANMTAEGPACDILKNATLKGREDPALRPPDSRESLDSWRFALQARRDKKLRKLDHEKFMPVLTAGEKRDLLLTYQVLAQAMKTAGVEFFLVDGSLLGAHRHYGLIPWDDDIDIGVNVLAWDTVRHTLGCIPGFRLVASERTHWKFFKTNLKSTASLGHMPSTKWSKQSSSSPSSSSRKIALSPPSPSPLSSPPSPPTDTSQGEKTNGFPFVDIFFYAHDERYLWAITTYLRESVIFRPRDVFPLGVASFEGLQVPVPRQVDVIVRHSFDIRSCCSPSLFHRTHTPREVSTVPCSELAYIYPLYNLD